MAASTLPPIPERAARGASLLDTHLPGWADRIDLNWLDEADLSGCVVGQVFSGNYTTSVQTLHGLVAGLDEAAYGFDVASDAGDQRDEDAAYVELTAAWKVQILARQTSGGEA